MFHKINLVYVMGTSVVIIFLAVQIVIVKLFSIVKIVLPVVLCGLSSADQTCSIHYPIGLVQEELDPGLFSLLASSPLGLLLVCVYI